MRICWMGCLTTIATLGSVQHVQAGLQSTIDAIAQAHEDLAPQVLAFNEASLELPHVFLDVDALDAGRHAIGLPPTLRYEPSDGTLTAVLPAYAAVDRVPPSSAPGTSVEIHGDGPLYQIAGMALESDVSLLDDHGLLRKQEDFVKRTSSQLIQTHLQNHPVLAGIYAGSDSISLGPIDSLRHYSPVDLTRTSLSWNSNLGSAVFPLDTELLEVPRVVAGAVEFFAVLPAGLTRREILSAFVDDNGAPTAWVTYANYRNELDFTYPLAVTVIPEPTTFAAAVIGFICLLVIRHRLLRT